MDQRFVKIPFLVGGVGLPSIWHFPRNIGLLSSSQLTKSIIFPEGWRKTNHQPDLVGHAGWGPPVDSVEQNSCYLFEWLNSMGFWYNYSHMLHL